MYVTPADTLGEDRIVMEDPIYYDEIAYLEVFQKIKSGQLYVSNDVDKCRELISSIRGISIVDVPGGMRIKAGEK